MVSSIVLQLSRIQHTKTVYIFSSKLERNKDKICEETMNNTQSRYIILEGLQQDELPNVI